MPAGIEFACPHCSRITRVPVTLAGKQGRCAGCRRVLEVPVGAPSSGRTPDPDEGLLEVLEARRASERLAAKKPSERVAAKALSKRLEKADNLSARRPSDQGSARHETAAPNAELGAEPGSEPEALPGADKTDDGGATTSLHIITPSPPAPLPLRTWVRRVPIRVFIGLVLSLPLPALGVALCVHGLRLARERNAGERVAWTGIGIGGSIMIMNLVVVAMRALSHD